MLRGNEIAGVGRMGHGRHRGLRELAGGGSGDGLDGGIHVMRDRMDLNEYTLKGGPWGFLASSHRLYSE